MKDEFELARFVMAQDAVYSRVLTELARGRKESHWMWFVFPQWKGLGSSAVAQRFGIGSRAEAEAYLVHPVLGERLRECTRLVNAVEGRTASDIFGYPDDLKFRSSMTLFAAVTAAETVFREALEKYFAGAGDSLTEAKLSR